MIIGSHARGANSEYADIDIALDSGRELPIKDVDEVKSMFRESNIRYGIDIVYMYQISDLMREQVLKHKIVWK